VGRQRTSFDVVDRKTIYTTSIDSSCFTCYPANSRQWAGDTVHISIHSPPNPPAFNYYPHKHIFVWWWVRLRPKWQNRRAQDHVVLACRSLGVWPGFAPDQDLGLISPQLLYNSSYAIILSTALQVLCCILRTD